VRGVGFWGVIAPNTLIPQNPRSYCTGSQRITVSLYRSNENPHSDKHPDKMGTKQIFFV
jgi:hypothetical protein